MASVIEPKSDQVNADDLQGRTMTITITDVVFKGGQEQPVWLSFAGSSKFYRPCKSMCRVLVAGWGLDASKYVGKSLTLYCDPAVKFGPLAVGGIRISHMSHIDGEMQMALTATKGVKKAYRVRPLEMEQKVDKVADGVRSLIARIGSDDVDGVTSDPDVVKQRAWLAKNRPELAAEVDAAVALKMPAADDPFSLPAVDDEEGPSDEQRGEVRSISPDELIRSIDAKVTVTEVTNLVKGWADAIAGFDEADVIRIEQAKADKIAEIKAAN